MTFMEARSTSWQAELDALLPPDINLHSQQSETTVEVPAEKQTLFRKFRKALYMALITFSADTVMVLNSETEQPHPLPNYHVRPHIHLTSYNQVSAPTPRLPHPEDDIQTIIDELDTDEKYQQFVKEYGNSMMPRTPWTFLSSYAYSPEEFRDNNWTGACNTYAEFSCEVGARHGKKMYQMALWPNGKKKDSSDNTADNKKHRHSWHIVSFYKKQDYTTGAINYVIFDNTTVTELDANTSLASWADDRGYAIIHPIGGIVEWERTARDCRAELGRHMTCTIQEKDIVPTITGEPAALMAQK